MNPLKMIFKKPRRHPKNPRVIYDIDEELKYREDEIFDLRNLIDMINDNNLRVITSEINREDGNFSISIGIAHSNFTGRLLTRNIKLYPNNLFKNLKFYITKDTELADFITEIFVDIEKDVSYASYLSKNWKVKRLYVSEDQGMIISFTLHRDDVKKIISKGFGEKDMIWLISIYANVWLMCQ